MSTARAISQLFLAFDLKSPAELDESVLSRRPDHELERAGLNDSFHFDVPEGQLDNGDDEFNVAGLARS